MPCYFLPWTLFLCWIMLSYVHSKPINRNYKASGTTWYEDRPEKFLNVQEIPKDVNDAKTLLNKLEVLERSHSYWLARLRKTANGEPSNPELSNIHLNLLPNGRNNMKNIEKRLLGKFHRRYLSKAAETLGNDDINRRVNMNYDLGKRSKPSNMEEDIIVELGLLLDSTLDDKNKELAVLEHNDDQNGMSLGELQRNYQGHPIVPTPYIAEPDDRQGGRQFYQKLPKSQIWLLDVPMHKRRS